MRAPQNILGKVCFNIGIDRLGAPPFLQKKLIVLPERAVAERIESEQRRKPPIGDKAAVYKILDESSR